MKNKTLFLGSIAIMLAITATTAFAETVTVASDGTAQWSADGTNWNLAVPTWVHPSWPSITGATWIWRTAQTDAPWEYANVPDGGWYFQKTFDIPECADMGTITGTLSVDADNSESSSINGHLLGQDGSLNKDGPDATEWNTIETYNLVPYLVSGENTLSFRALNYFNYGPYTSNPAGLIYKADITYTSTDTDGDGVCASADFCPVTVADSSSTVPTSSLGVNRWMWDGSSWKTGQIPGKGKGPQLSYTIDQTHGCSCKQILDWLHANYPDQYGNMGGQYKFGCSISIMQDFIKLTESKTFTAADSTYYNCPDVCSSVYGSGAISFTWNPITGAVTSGYYNEIVPPSTGTTYYNVVTGGSVVGNAVSLTFSRTNPNSYGPFYFTGTLSGNVLTGQLDGPYYFTATGI